MNNNKKIILLLISLICFTDCDDFLDAFPSDKVSEESFWKSSEDVNKFVTNIYSSTFPVVYEGSIFFDEAMSDNAYLVWDGWYTNVKHIANGTLDTYGTAPYNIWSQQYKNIRQCLQVYENIDKIANMDISLKQRLLAEVNFLEAYNYHRLVIFFNHVPLVTKVMNLEESKTIPQSSRTEVVTHILTLLDKAAAGLQTSSGEKGRATWGGAIALKARVLLNENRFADLLSVTNELIGKYTLHTEGETPYEDLFSGKAEDSEEIIFSIQRTQSLGSIKTGHYSNQIFFLKGMSGGDAFRAITPSGSLIDSYPMADGRLIKEKGVSYNPKEPYKDRDPRFYQSVIYPTGQIKYWNGRAVAERLYDPEDETTIPEQQYNAKEPSPTGYMWNKYVDWSPYAMVQITDCTNDIILIRYADILLMHAEALAETKGVAAKEEVVELINQLRERCKGGKVHHENYNSKEEIINLIRNERRVELANEGLRYFDLLRWKIAEKSPVNDGVGLKGEVYGALMRLDGVGTNDRTILIDGVPRRYIEIRYFNPEKNYLLPIPQKEIELNELLEQNPGW